MTSIIDQLKEEAIMFINNGTLHAAIDCLRCAQSLQFLSDEQTKASEGQHDGSGVNNE
jgi:hypothetical protein